MARTNTEMHRSTVYMRTTDKNHRVTVTEHRVWDVELFFKAQKRAANKEGAAVTEATKEEYIRFREAGRHHA